MRLKRSDRVRSNAGVPAFRRRSKYHAVKVKADGITFDSKAEYARYLQLRLLEKAGKIRSLLVHFSVDLRVGDTKIGVYIADFFYQENGASVLEDVKGVRTAVYRLKKKILAANGITIREVAAKDLRITKSPVCRAFGPAGSGRKL